MKPFLKLLILTTILISLLTGFFPEVQKIFSLSWAGIKSLFLWQFITYIFTETGPISLGFFFSLAFNMYLLWMFGTSLIERIGLKTFLILYFTAPLIGALAALPFSSLTLAGSTNAVYPLLIVWMMLNPYSQLLLFFTLPFKSYLLILSLIGISIILELSSGRWEAGISLLISCIYSYFFSLIVWRKISPITFLNPFEKKVLKLLEKKVDRLYHSSKIYDIKSGKPILDDEQFMDAMLDRIARHGEGSLTRSEKKRMKEISKRSAQK